MKEKKGARGDEEPGRWDECCAPGFLLQVVVVEGKKRVKVSNASRTLLTPKYSSSVA